jgi:hypothetical protein
VDDERAVLGRYQQAMADGAGASFTFDGSNLWLVTHRRPEGGQLEVTVDDGVPVTVSLYAPQLISQVRVPLAQALPRGQHRVHVNARFDPQAGPGPVIDGFIVARQPSAWLRRGVGAAALAVGLVALGWLFGSQRRMGLNTSPHKRGDSPVEPAPN